MIKEVLKKENWTDKAEFLQSWEYGEFLKETGRNVLRYEYNSEKNEIVQFQGILSKNIWGMNFFYIPRVLFDKETLLIISKFFENKNYTFLRLELTKEIDLRKIQHKEVINRQPENSWLLDLDKPLDELLKKMHSKTRYNIKLAKKKGVTVKLEKDIEKYWEINKMTTERNDIKSHQKDYLQKLLKLKDVYQINTYFEEEVLSSAIVLKHLDTMYYLFGASSNQKRNLMAPYLNQFSAIKLAIEKKCKIYDFWGIAPPAEKGSKEAGSHHQYSWKKDSPLAGVAKFKAGFGGRLMAYPRAVEIILQKNKYRLFSFLQKIKKPTITGYSNKK